MTWVKEFAGVLFSSDGGVVFFFVPHDLAFDANIGS